MSSTSTITGIDFILITLVLLIIHQLFFLGTTSSTVETSKSHINIIHLIIILFLHHTATQTTSVDSNISFIMGISLLSCILCSVFTITIILIYKKIVRKSNCNSTR